MQSKLTVDAGGAVCEAEYGDITYCMALWNTKERRTNSVAVRHDTQNILELLWLPLSRGTRLVCAILPASQHYECVIRLHLDTCCICICV